jgi:hypothetical protein
VYTTVTGVVPDTGGISFSSDGSIYVFQYL